MVVYYFNALELSLSYILLLLQYIIYRYVTEAKMVRSRQSMERNTIKPSSSFTFLAINCNTRSLQ